MKKIILDRKTIYYVSKNKKEMMALIIALDGKFHVETLNDLAVVRRKLKRGAKPKLILFDCRSFQSKLSFLDFLKETCPDIPVIPIVDDRSCERSFDMMIPGPMLDCEGIKARVCSLVE